MATVIMEVDGVNALAMIELQIQSFEACAKKFVSSEVKSTGKKSTNHVTFERLKAGTRPQKYLHLVLASQSLPSGMTEIWKGKMVCKASKADVIAYR